MSPIHDEGVVLAHTDYSETSEILAIFTRNHGQIRAIGKGVKRGTKTKPAIGIDVLDTGDLVLQARADRSGLSTLTEWRQVHPCGRLRDRLTRIHGALYAVELITALTVEWDPHPELYEGLRELLGALCEADDCASPVVKFQRRLLESAGLMPRWECCLRCGGVDRLDFFSARQGSMMCERCGPHEPGRRRVSPQTLQSMLNPDAMVSAAGPMALLNHFLAFTAGRQFRMVAGIAAEHDRPKSSPTA